MIASIAESVNPVQWGRLEGDGGARLRFEAVLDRELDVPVRGPVSLEDGRTTERDEELYEAAQQLVASAFVAPLLAQVRASARENDMFYGGSTEDLFGHRMDEQLADRIVRSSRFPMVDAVYRQIAGAGGAGGGDGGALGGRVNTHG